MYLSGFRASQAEQLETFVFNVSGRVHESNWFLYLSAACFVIYMNDDIITDPHNQCEIFSIIKICNLFTCSVFSFLESLKMTQLAKTNWTSSRLDSAHGLPDNQRNNNFCHVSLLAKNDDVLFFCFVGMPTFYLFHLLACCCFTAPE